MYGIAIDDPACPLTWAQFLTRVRGLRSTDCRIARYFAPDQTPQEALP